MSEQYILNYKHKCPTCGSKLDKKSGKPAKWRRILYMKQDFEDNYVDESFLSYLDVQQDKKAVHSFGGSFWDLAKETAIITQQISVVTIFFVVFFLTSLQWKSVQTLIIVDTVVIVFGSLLILILSELNERDEDVPIEQFFKPTTMIRLLYHRVDYIMELIPRGIIFVGALLGLSPVLHTLTRAYASDTIWALSITLSALHLALFDYWYINTATKKTQHSETRTFQGTVSMNAAIFVSVLLASRLESAMAVFAFIFFAFEMFAGVPVLLYNIRAYSINGHLLTTVFLFSLSVYLLTFTQRILIIAYVLIVVVITLICPFWLKRVLRYKNEIIGPWDYDDETEGLG